ncbi:flagellar biosynthetic protein FliO [Cellulomonas bogoriensis]|uniref:Flagellar protein n=1 Tax=Cellulomonas bogoriensis 69B4 = DSM 16987 TaxID=1386082 RepID=A0A0A0BL07_9CELL|nr:flagellar biosynthetic protein FliO [Cellulomonas bogoriensis]KGM08357.1 hypothetical protein N869_06405 [Cellulomonas bogoriensis 69B4 = DSM 16987]
MDSSDLVLGLRVLLSLGCVLGLLWLIARRVQGTSAARRRRAEAMTVVGRQSLGGKAGLALVEVGGRRLLLGVGEQGVSLLTEMEMPEPEPEPDGDARVELDAATLERLVADVPADVSSLVAMDGDPTGHAGTTPESAVVAPAAGSSSTPAARTPAVPKPRNPLEGSILDVTMWRRAVVAVQERTIRR